MVVGSGPVGLLGIGILQDRPISHRKLVLQRHLRLEARVGGVTAGMNPEHPVDQRAVVPPRPPFRASNASSFPFSRPRVREAKREEIRSSSVNSWAAHPCRLLNSSSRSVW